MSNMKQHFGEHGQLNVLLVPVITLAVLFIGVGSFAVWAYGSQQDYKKNTDAKIAVAVAANTKTIQAQDAAQYAEAAKNPLVVYNGPDAYGSLQVSYPKTWSAYIDTTNSSRPLDAYFHPGYVPAVNSKQTYNLRVQVVAQAYSAVLATFSGKITAGKVTATPYTLPKVPNVIGTTLTGEVIPSQPNGGTGTLVLLPLRSTTLEIWTESNDYLPDFNTYILPNLTFSP